MDQHEKYFARARFALCIKKILSMNKALQSASKRKSIKEHQLVTSIRQLSGASDVEYSIIQTITSGKRNPELTTVAALADGLGIAITKLFEYYVGIPEADVKKFVREKILPFEKQKELLRKKEAEKKAAEATNAVTKDRSTRPSGQP